MVAPHDDGELPSRNHNRVNNGREKTEGKPRMMILDWIMKGSGRTNLPTVPIVRQEKAWRLF